MSPRPQIDHIRRPQLLAAAAEVIAERGFAATRIADVAERAGTSPRPSSTGSDASDELLAEALTPTRSAFHDELAARLDGIDDPAAWLVALIDCLASATTTGRCGWSSGRGPAARPGAERPAPAPRRPLARQILARRSSARGRARRLRRPRPRAAALELAALIDGLAVQVALGDRR